MAEFKIKNYDGKVYLKEDLLRILNTRELRAIANAETVLLFADDTPLDAVEASLNIIMQDIQLRKKKLIRENNQTLPIDK